jgi:kynurenine formamidase
MLFEAGITILEGLRLNGVPEDEYILFAAPINIVGAEAAPVRAILLK